MTHGDRAGDPSGHRADRREAAGDAGHRQGLPTPAGGLPAAGSPARPERRLPKAARRPDAFGRGAGLAMPLHRRATRSWPKALGIRLNGSTIEIRMEKAVDVVARWVGARTRGSELSTYPRRWR